MFPTGGVSFLLLLLPVPQLPSCAPGFCGSMYLLLVRLLFDFVIKHGDWRMLFEFKPDVYCSHFLITLRWSSGLSPHPSSCGSFLQCAGDELHTIHCPPGGTSSFFKIISKCQVLLLTQCLLAPTTVRQASSSTQRLFNATGQTTWTAAAQPQAPQQVQGLLNQAAQHPLLKAAQHQKQPQLPESQQQQQQKEPAPKIHQLKGKKC